MIKPIEVFTDIISSQLISTSGLLKLIDSLQNDAKVLANQLVVKADEAISLKKQLEEAREDRDFFDVGHKIKFEEVGKLHLEIKELKAQLEQKIEWNKKISAWRDNYYRRASKRNAEKLKLMKLIVEQKVFAPVIIWDKYNKWLKQRRKNRRE